MERAAGHPLFLEQLLRSAGEALREALPGSIQSLVLARLDRLAPADKPRSRPPRCWASQRFEIETWRALVDVPFSEPLVDAGLLRPDDAAAQFVHALIRDGAYASLLKTRRRELHLRSAAWYATRDPGLHAEHLALADIRGGSRLRPGCARRARALPLCGGTGVGRARAALRH